MTAREGLAETLKPMLPKGWNLIPYQDNTDTLSDVTVMLKQTSLTKFPGAPLGSYLSEFIVTVVDPTIDPAKAEDRLDDEVHELLAALDGINNTLWSRAEKVLFNETHLAWDITVQVVTRKES